MTSATPRTHESWESPARSGDAGSDTLRSVEFMCETNVKLRKAKATRKRISLGRVAIDTDTDTLYMTIQMYTSW